MANIAHISAQTHPPNLPLEHTFPLYALLCSPRPNGCGHVLRHWRMQKLTDQKLRSGLERTEKKFEDAAHSTAVAELLLPEDAGYLEAEGMEETFKFGQDQIKVLHMPTSDVTCCSSSC